MKYKPSLYLVYFKESKVLLLLVLVVRSHGVGRFLGSSAKKARRSVGGLSDLLGH